MYSPAGMPWAFQVYRPDCGMAARCTIRPWMSWMAIWVADRWGDRWGENDTRGLPKVKRKFCKVYSEEGILRQW